ncbi:unnamed protein product [Meganyctiphanes norvegica]|uniref:Uncharacterized protein n=2 Tax=Meganyctiphanes norvegica TaxID=48144 RepID=A0AAV2S951_MEGNR
MGSPLQCYCRLMCGCMCPHCCDRQDQDGEDHQWQEEDRSHRKQNHDKTVYVLLLGAAESGKSTIMRQMKIIQNNGLSTATLRSYTKHVLDNVLTCAQRIIQAVQEAAVPWGTPEASHAAHVLGPLNASEWGIILGLDQGDPTIQAPPLLPPDHAHLVQVLWADSASQECWRRANEFNLPDSTAYYLGNLERLAQAQYTPTMDDVLRLRIPTRAATVYDLRENDWTIRITDVGGQRGERRRWLRLFDNINAIIFLAALSEYDQSWSEEEEDGLNRLQLSINLFREVVQYPGFQPPETMMILFLNKVDVFGHKIQSSDLHHTFPDYEGIPGDSRAALDYIRGRFHKQAPGRPPGTPIYTHETCATDTEATRFVFAAVRDNILFANIRRFMDPFDLEKF